jgi:hypothetical protein
MNKFLFCVITAVMLVSCVSKPENPEITPPEEPETGETAKAPRAYTISDYKNKTRGGYIPEWANLWFDSGIREVETLGAFRDRFLFIARNEGNNHNALNLWKDGFSPELDFPRLAAVRIEARFSGGVPYPDEVYGAFYETLIRAASDAHWTGMIIEDDFWIRRKFMQSEDESEREDWEFFVLVSIDRTVFTSQLNTIFEKLNPRPPPTEGQIAAAGRVKDRFFEGF